jgi:hypothetical protein
MGTQLQIMDQSRSVLVQSVHSDHPAAEEAVTYADPLVGLIPVGPAWYRCLKRWVKIRNCGVGVLTFEKEGWNVSMWCPPDVRDMVRLSARHMSALRTIWILAVVVSASKR